MARLSISALFEASKLKATKAGAEVAELIDSYAQLVKELVPALRNGLTLTDNLSCEAKEVDLLSDTAQVVSTAGGKVLTDIIPSRVVATDVVLDSFSWWLDNQGRLTVKAGLLKNRAIVVADGENCVSGTVPSERIKVRLLLFYGNA